MKLKSAIIKAQSLLKNNNIKSYILDSEILMSKTMNEDRKYVILNPNKILSELELNEFNNLILERAKGKPVAYLTGRKSFWNYEFNVSKDVLIPRPDTELILEQALFYFKNKSKIKILDIGTGSGCILLSILKERNDFQGIGIDISKKCLDLSKINALRLGIINRVKFFKSDIDNFNLGKYDLIISNPPYINKLELKYLDKDIIGYEPLIALNGGLEGTSEISKVISKSSELIKKKGKLIIEIAFNQRDKVKRILKSKGFYINKVLKDFAKNDRCIVSTKI